MKSAKHPLPFEIVLKLIRHQRSALRDAGASRSIVNAYDAVLSHLSTLSSSEVDRLLSKSRSDVVRPEADTFDPARLTLDEVEAMIREESVPRRRLEVIAIGRFNVPKGSMRSFSSINDLREKISTLVQNERAHRTISEVASRSRV